MAKADTTELSEEEQSKDEFFRQIAELAEAMLARHGKEFSMGAFVLAAQWIAENRIVADTPGTKKAGG
jgi:hypothetical protein